jgi:hypothetical protein
MLMMWRIRWIFEKEEEKALCIEGRCVFVNDTDIPYLAHFCLPFAFSVFSPCLL